MNLKSLNIEATLRRIAEKRVEDAIAEGKFDDLPGRGEPVEIDEAPADENARALWWALRVMRQNDFVPDEVRWRKSVERLKGELYRATDPAAARRLCVQINALVHRLNTMGTNAIRIPVLAVDTEAAVARRTGASSARHAGS